MAQLSKHGKIIWLIGVPIIICLLTLISSNLGAGIMALVALFLIVNIIYPIKKSGITGRGVAIGSLLLCLLIGGIFMDDPDEARLQALKAENPTAYLAELKVEKPARYLKEAKILAPEEYLSTLKETDADKWLQELAVLKPGIYAEKKAELEEQKAKLIAQQEAERVALIKEKKALALAIPASDFAKNIAAYNELSKLEPDVQSHKDKITEYKEKQKAAQQYAKKCGDDAKFDAFFYAKEYVKRSLKAPSTAKFRPYREAIVRTGTGCTFTVVGYVDAQNSFGAMLRNRYEVKLHHTENGNWAPKKIDIQ